MRDKKNNSLRLLAIMRSTYQDCEDDDMKKLSEIFRGKLDFFKFPPQEKTEMTSMYGMVWNGVVS